MIRCILFDLDGTLVDTWDLYVEAYIRTLDAAKVYYGPIVTQVVPLKGFYAAEDYHQKFLDKNPDYPYIVFWDLPKIASLKKTHPDLVTEKM